MKFLCAILGDSWRVLTLAVCTSLLAGLSSTGLLVLINVALQEMGQTLPALASGFVALCVAVLLSSVLSKVLLVRLGQDRVFELRMDLSRRILAAPLRQLQQLGRHRLLATLAEDIAKIAEAYQIVPVLLINGATVLGCLVYLGWLAWDLVLVVLVFIAIGMVSYHCLQQRALKWLRLARKGDDRLYSHFRALTEGNKELKMHEQRRKAFLEDQLRSTADRIRRNVNTGLTVYVFASQWGNLLFYTVIGLVIFAVTLFETVPRPAQIGYTLTILFMMNPLAAIMDVLPSIGRGAVALQKIEDLGLSLAEQTREHESCDTVCGASAPAVLELIGVSHTYYHDMDDHSFTLGPIHLAIHPGELVFVVGGNGSGKTTLALLLLGLYVPEQGQIRLNGIPITDDNRDVYRQHFAAVFADAYVFETLLGFKDAEFAERAQALMIQLQLEHKVRIRGRRFSTVELSQGQRKRLALLSAYLDNRPFYLFDEWAADQDPLFKDVFYNELLPQLKTQGKTVVVITHDDQYYHVADRCIRLLSGNIAADVAGEHYAAKRALFGAGLELL